MKPDFFEMKHEIDSSEYSLAIDTIKVVSQPIFWVSWVD